MTEYKRGDRVKVTIEGTVERVETVRAGTVTELKIATEDDASRPYQYVYDIDGVEIEVLAPPARPFQVGDRVRRAYDGLEWVLGDAGYLVVKEGTCTSTLGRFHFYTTDLETSFPTGDEHLILVEPAS